MHEYGIVQSLLERVEAEARARGALSVGRIHLRIGELSGVETDLLKTAFATFRARSVAAGAELMILQVPALWTCPRCGEPLAKGAILSCPQCAVPARLAQGDELFLDRIEMEVPDV